MAETKPSTTATAIFAGGCFWCMQSEFDSEPGVISTSVGYTGGSEQDATYEKVGTGKTDHVEAIEVSYDPAKVSYDRLLTIFWRNIDPTDEGGQFADRGKQYYTAIFYANAEEKALAEASKQKAEATLGKKIVTPILPTEPFYDAEDYHQGYYKKNPLRYQMYKQGSGRAAGVKELWGDK